MTFDVKDILFQELFIAYIRNVYKIRVKSYNKTHCIYRSFENILKAHYDIVQEVHRVLSSYR